MPPQIMVAAEVKIDFCTLGQPKLDALLWEHLRSVVDGHMFAQQLDLRHRANQIGFDVDDAKPICRYPGAPFQADWVRPARDFVFLNAARTIRSLLESNQPSRSPMPVAQSFACHTKIFPLVGMKNECERGQSPSSNMVGEVFGIGALITKLANIKYAGPRL